MLTLWVRGGDLQIFEILEKQKVPLEFNEISIVHVLIDVPQIDIPTSKSA